MKAHPQFGEILEAAETLSIEDREALIEVLHRRIVESRREQILKDVQDAEEEFKAGQCQPANVSDLMKEILP